MDFPVFDGTYFLNKPAKLPLRKVDLHDRGPMSATHTQPEPWSEIWTRPVPRDPRERLIRDRRIRHYMKIELLNHHPGKEANDGPDDASG
ncbi:MAG: hypothetical protein ACM359_11100 [Bacillota bacterium]